MLLRILDRGSSKKRKKKVTRVQIEAEDAYLRMQARLDALPKFARTPRPKGMSLLDFPKLETPPGRTNTKHIKSLNAADGPEDGYYYGASFKESPKYTGTKMKGVAVLHKSNGIPVFSDEEIVDISKMRR